MSERKVIPIEEKIIRMEPWQRNIYNTNQFLTQDIERLWEVDPTEREGQVVRIRSRILNLTRAVMEAYESREIPGSFPQFRLIDYVQEGPRFYYFFEESQVRKITTPPRRLHSLRGEDFTRSEVIPTQEWVMDDYLRDRVVDNLRGMVPYGTLTLK